MQNKTVLFHIITDAGRVSRGCVLGADSHHPALGQQIGRHSRCGRERTSEGEVGFGPGDRRLVLACNCPNKFRTRTLAGLLTGYRAQSSTVSSRVTKPTRLMVVRTLTSLSTWWIAVPQFCGLGECMCPDKAKCPRSHHGGGKKKWRRRRSNSRPHANQALLMRSARSTN